LAEASDSRVTLAPAMEAEADVSWLALSDVAVPEETLAQFWASASGPLRVWLDGRPVHSNESRRDFKPNSDRFEATLAKGVNRLLLQVSAPRAQLHLWFRPKSSSAEKERLAQLALEGKGDPARGHAVFFDPLKAQCFKCHRIGGEGGAVGPELTGVGARFTRIHLVESILEPSRAIAPSFETSVVILKDGQVMTGIKLAETDTALTLGDSQGESRTLPKAAVAELHLDSTSVMPEGLEKQLTPAELLDLVEFLLSLQEHQ
jgi:putative heme-binding domain-containing protein